MGRIVSMVTYKDLYFHLFNILTDALEAPDLTRTREILRRTQIDAEELYISEGPNVIKLECGTSKSLGKNGVF